jgi:hypothetical protein
MLAQQSGSPMTSMWKGMQYITVAISGRAYSGEYIAFRLPEAPEVAPTSVSASGRASEDRPE